MGKLINWVLRNCTLLMLSLIALFFIIAKCKMFKCIKERSLISSHFVISVIQFPQNLAPLNMRWYCLTHFFHPGLISASLEATRRSRQLVSASVLGFKAIHPSLLLLS